MVAEIQTLTPLTIEDLARFPDDGLRREIVSGELVVTPAPIPAHQIIIGRLFRIVADFVEAHGLGEVVLSPVDVRLSIHSIVQPDIVFIPAERKSLLRGTFIDGLPEIVVEVLSHSTRRMDLMRKRALYAGSGITEYWIVDLDRQTLEINRLDNGMYVPVVLESENPRSFVLKNLEIDVVKLFSDMP